MMSIICTVRSVSGDSGSDLEKELAWVLRWNRYDLRDKVLVFTEVINQYPELEVMIETSLSSSVSSNVSGTLALS